MPSHDPSDDFSQLPTADGLVNPGSASRPGSHQPPLRRQQTRIGPRATPEETAPAAEDTPAENAPDSLADEWNDLIQSTGLHDADPYSTREWPAHTDPELPHEPETEPPFAHKPAAAAPRRTVVGKRAPQADTDEAGQPDAKMDTPQPPEEALPEETPAAPAAPRRTVVGRRPPEEPAAPEPPPAAPGLASKLKKRFEKKVPAPQAQNPEKEKAPDGPAPAAPGKAPVAAALSLSKQTSDSAPSGSTDTPADASSAKAEAPKDPAGKETSETPPSPAEDEGGPWRQRWERWGGRALSVSVIIHVLLLFTGALVVVTQVIEPQVDFLPGGGTQQGAAASQDLEHKIQQKKTPWLKKPVPMRKIAAVNSISDIVLPDEVPDLMDLPQSKDLLSASKLTTGMGFAGSGGGSGKGIGIGGQSGIAFQPFSMFGMQIKAKRLALVLDVSTSMAPHLPRVIEEVDKVARGSIVILYFGCGLEPPPPQGLEGDEIFSTSGVEFEKFWRLGGATLTETRKFRIDPKKEIQSASIYRILSKRPQTFFIHNTGLGYTWLALLNDKLRTADGIYWFSDFQDSVDFRQLTIVRENLERRKQRLYMHAYTRGSSYDLVKSQLVDPTQGDVKLED